MAEVIRLSRRMSRPAEVCRDNGWVEDPRRPDRVNCRSPATFAAPSCLWNDANVETTGIVHTTFDWKQRWLAIIGSLAKFQ